MFTFPSQRGVEVNVRHVLEDIDQDGDGVRGMFVGEVNGQFCESNIAMHCGGRLASRLLG